jgi:membrane protease YdiL (CAAX protease family)
MDFKRLAGTMPYIFTLFLLAVLVGTSLLASLIIVIFNLSGETVQVYRVLIEDIVRAGVAVYLLSRLGWWRLAGYTNERPADLKLFWLPLLPAVMNLASGVRTVSFQDALLFLFIALLVGFVEETYFRGLMLRAFASRGAWRAAIITAVCFGLLHTLNVFANWNTAYVIQQVIYAAAIGFMYAALAIRTGTIWPLIVVHAATDFTAFLAVGTLAPPSTAAVNEVLSITDILILFGYVIYGIFLLAGRQRSNRISRES